ncbi:MAG: cytochrome c [Deltaproteobacteria bacterium]|nr:cytochrome c [Deltaproteobacteria bacterium]
MKNNNIRLFIVLSAVGGIGLLFYAKQHISDTGSNTGNSLYLAHCASCHGPLGKGLRNLYPSLRKNPYLSTKISELPCLIRQGVKGKIITEKGTYNQLMPPFKTFTSAELLQLISFMQQRWSSSSTTELTPNVIEQWLDSCPHE